MKSRNSPPSIDELQTLTARQVADILQCSIKSVNRYCRKGLFPQPIAGVGRLRRWKKSAVAQFLARNSSPNSES